MTRSIPWRFDLGRFDVRSTLPAAIQQIMQNGLLERTFEDALLPDFLYPALATQRPWQANLGDTAFFTRTGLLTPKTAPITGSDPAVDTYGIEQYSLTMDQYGNAVDTNLLQSAMTLSSKFLEDVQKLGINAGQSLNQVARNKLYKAYAGGRTWVTTAQGAASTTCVVQSANGFDTVLVNGRQTAVSGGNPLNVTINGVANTVVGVNLATNTLTLGAAVTQSIGQSVIAANAPVSFRPTGNTAFDLSSANVATAAMFRSAVARLRTMSVPTVNGNYIAHVDATTEQELFADADFKQAYQGRGDSAVFQNMSIGTFLGIDWVRNQEAPTVLGGAGQNLTIHRPVVFGADALISGPFENMGELLAGTGVQDIPNIRMVGPAAGVQVALIVRPPQDRLQQIVSSAWSWVGDLAVPSDATTGDASVFKRGVLIEHA